MRRVRVEATRFNRPAPRLFWRPLRAGVAALLAIASVLRAGHAFAETEVLQTIYSAPHECPQEDSFWQELALRTQLARRATDKSFDRTFQVHVETAPAGYTGRLEIVEPSGEHALRTLEDTDCVELVRALSFVAAIAVQEKARQKAASAVAASAEHKRKAARRAPPESKHNRGLSPALALEGALLTTPAPKTLVAGGIRVELASTSAGMWSPALYVAGLFAQTGIVGKASELARFSWWGAQIEFCALRFTRWPSLEARPCVIAELAALEARGDGAARVGRATRFWADVGALAALRWHWLANSFVEGALGFVLPTTRDDFVFTSPHVLVHHPNAVGLSTNFSAGIEFR